MTKSVENLTPEEIEVLEYVNMGLPMQKDIAFVMGLSSRKISKVRNSIEQKNPFLYYDYYSNRVDSAIELRIQGFTWGEISNSLSTQVLRQFMLQYARESVEKQQTIY